LVGEKKDLLFWRAMVGMKYLSAPIMCVYVKARTMGDALYEAAKIWVDTESQGVPWYVLYSCVNKACVHSHFVLN